MTNYKYLSLRQPCMTRSARSTTDAGRCQGSAAARQSARSFAFVLQLLRVPIHDREPGQAHGPAGEAVHSAMRYSEALAVHDGWARFIVLTFGDPHLLERGQRTQNGSTNPHAGCQVL